MTERVRKIQTIQRTGDAESPVQVGLSETSSRVAYRKRKLFSLVGYDGFPTVKTERI